MMNGVLSENKTGQRMGSSLYSEGNYMIVSNSYAKE